MVATRSLRLYLLLPVICTIGFSLLHVLILENEIEKMVNTYARETGWLQYKFVSPGKRGVPDRIYFYRGHCLVIEYKALGKKATALQEKELRAIRSAGIDGYVIDNVTEGKDVLDRHKTRWGPQ